MSHSQSFPTRPVATFQEGDTIILEVPVILAFVMANRLLRTGTHEPKSISASVREKLQPHPSVKNSRAVSPAFTRIHLRV